MIAGSYVPDSEVHRNKLASSRGDFGDGYLFVVLARLFRTITDHVPLGYEDDDGFHWEQVPIRDEDS